MRIRVRVRRGIGRIWLIGSVLVAPISLIPILANDAPSGPRLLLLILAVWAFLSLLVLTLAILFGIVLWTLKWVVEGFIEVQDRRSTGGPRER